MKPSLKIQAFSYTELPKDPFAYSIALGQVNKWHYTISNGARTYYSSRFHPEGLSSKAAAIKAARSISQHLRALKML